MDFVVIGCGNVLRGDDGAGPALVRRLAERGLPPTVRCVDAGTAGVDAVLAMRGVDEVLVVDACRTGRPPGSIVEVGAEHLAALAPHGGVDVHGVRWDHALTLARLLLGAEFPARVGAWLVEGRSFVPGAALSPEVDRAVDRLADRLADMFGGRVSVDVAASGPASRET